MEDDKRDEEGVPLSTHGKFKERTEGCKCKYCTGGFGASQDEPWEGYFVERKLKQKARRLHEHRNSLTSDDTYHNIFGSKK